MDKNQTASDTKRVQLRLNKRQFDELKMLADYDGRSVSDVIKQLISAHLRDNSSKEA